MAAPQSDESGNEGSFHGLLRYFWSKTFLCMTIIWLVDGVPSKVIIRATIKELYDDKHAKRENGSSAMLFYGEHGSSIWRVRELNPIYGTSMACLYRYLNFPTCYEVELIAG